MARLRAVWWNAEERRPRAGWRLLVYLLLVAAIANPLVILLDATDHPLLEGSFENVLVAIGFLLALVIAARFIERRPLRDFGLYSPLRSSIELAWGLVLGATAMAVACMAQYAAGWVTVQSVPRTEIPATPFVLAFAGQVARYAGGSVFEELFSRSYLLRLIAEQARGVIGRSARAVLVAAVVTSVFFGLLHVFNPDASLVAVVNLSLLGLLFAVPMIVTGRLALSIGLHAGWNIAMNVVLGLPNSGKPSTTSLLTTHDVGPALWTGGSFGPEGGLVVTVTLLVALVLTALWWVRVHGCRLALSLADPPLSARNPGVVLRSQAGT